MAARRLDSEEYVAATEVARRVRSVVADQIAGNLRDGDRMGSLEEVGERVERVNFCLRQVRQAQGRQQQARVMGLPMARPAADEREFRELLREAVLELAVSCGSAVAGMDYEQARVEADRDG